MGDGRRGEHRQAGPRLTGCGGDAAARVGAELDRAVGADRHIDAAAPPVEEGVDGTDHQPVDELNQDAAVELGVPGVQAALPEKRARHLADDRDELVDGCARQVGPLPTRQ
jgi:hypothetical protein